MTYSLKEIAVDTEGKLSAMPIGSYKTDLGFYSNDPSRPLVKLPVNIEVIANSELSSWKTEHFAEDNLLFNGNLSSWADHANPDGDQLPNKWEFMFGKDPNQKDGYSLLTAKRENDNLFVEFQAHSSVTSDEINVEWSSDLTASSWSTQGLLYSHEGADSDTSLSTWRVYLNSSILPVVFFRPSDANGP